MMRYLQHDMLQKTGLLHFDSWAAAFGEKVTAIELAPSGQGFRAKTRFSRFFNLPELMSLWKNAADVQTADMLKLPVPEAEHITVKTSPSDWQKDAVSEFAVRAEMVYNRKVLPHEDNLLKITSDGRKLALDQRLYDPSLPDEPNSKASSCAKNVLEVWRDTAAVRGTQLVFCDISTPNGDGKFNVYDDLKAKLMAGGIPEKEIEFIHNAETEAQKAALFAKVRKGQVRVLLGSTQKMGAGTNIQDHLAALHHLDAPWRPADLEQREGRILRFGNQNKHVKIYKYVTEQTFDSYSWAILENKQKFIGQIMTSKSPARSAEDVDATALNYAEIKALAVGDERIKEKMGLDIDVTKLRMLKANHDSQRYTLEDRIAKYYPQSIQKATERIAGFNTDRKHLENSPSNDFSMTVSGVDYTERKLAGEAIADIMAELRQCKNDDAVEIGSYRGFPMTLSYSAFGDDWKISLKGKMTYSVNLGQDIVGNTLRVSNILEEIPKMLSESENSLATLQEQLAAACEEVQRPFEKETELSEKSARLAQLNIELDMNSHEADAEVDVEVTDPETKPATSELNSGISQPEKKPSILARLAAGNQGYQKNPDVPVKRRDSFER